MRAAFIYGAALCVVLGFGPSRLQAVGQQPAAPAPASQGKPKPAPEKEKQNRPKPENQPGAVKDAEKLAASHAGHHEMKKLEGGGVLPEGWHHRFDLPDMKLEDLRFIDDNGNLHVTSGPPGIYYNHATTATGEYVVKATFTQLSKGEHREGYGPFVGGAELDGSGQKYLYFLIRQDGRFLIKQRSGANTTGVTDWTPHRAIKPFGADGKMTNELAIAVTADTVRFLVNGTEVAKKPRAGLNTDGIVGLRVNHQLDLAIKGFTVQR
jgi:hypothetical protein